MRSLRTRRASALVGAALVILALLLAACGSGGAQTGASAPAAASDGGDQGRVPAASGGAGQESGGGEQPAGDFAPVEQRIIKTGEVGLEVDNVAGILAQVRVLAVELGGYIGGSQAGTLDESASITLRVPAARFDELLTRLHELEDTKVVAESTREQDVTREIVDLEARVRNLQASEASYREFLERAEKIDDVLAVQSRLDEVRGQIEQLQAQLQTVSGQADLSTLTVTLIPRSEPVAAVQEGWDPGATWSSAVASLVGIGQGLFDVLVWFVVVWLPVLIVIGVIALVVWRVAVEVRRRMPQPERERQAG
ncbi:MAG TPA: DUF4349 domain-containing protein [Candidatus Limnocylindria bacterium]|nr:DUF4349 domain-containing protein [Candidatus Limnocylindria bacterium]